MTHDRVRRRFLLLLVVCISVAFLWLIQTFLVTILLAALAAGIAYPLYQALLYHTGGRRIVSSLVTMLSGLLIVGIPLGVVVAMATGEAIKVTQNITPWVQRFAAEPTALAPYIERIPYAEQLAPYRDVLLTRIGELANNLGGLIVGALSSTTVSTLTFVVNFFIFLYTLFFLLMDGPAMIGRIKRFVPLPANDRDRLFDKFLSVTRATLKGTIVIGVVQGTLGGLAFAVLGISGAVFWGVVMVVFSVLPVVGGALVWVPAAIVLALSGQFLKAVLLVAFCGLVVGSVDNVLRPRLVGRDTEMHDLMILFSTLGGIMAFGAVGFILGPIIAALFQTVWELMDAAFDDVWPRRQAPVLPVIVGDAGAHGVSAEHPAQHVATVAAVAEDGDPGDI